MAERFRIIPFEEQYFEQLRNLIKEGWNEKHIFLKSEELLRWEYTGYGSMKGMNFPLLLDGDDLIGFRLMTPIEIMTINANNEKRIYPTAVSTVWFLKKEYRGQKLGLKMQLYTIEKYNGYFAIASNLRTSAPIHKKSGAKMLDTMNRYFRPLQEDISELIVAENSKHAWNYVLPQGVLKPIDIDARELAEVWSASISGKKVTALNRSEEFWQWRYLDSPIYKYLFFKNEAGCVVGRVCDLYDEKKQKTGKKIFRLLEVIPKEQTVWDGQFSESLSELLNGVCGWATGQGCMASEFYMSTSRFDKVMNAAYFDEINKKEAISSNVMSYFEPCDTAHRLSNVSLLTLQVADDFDFEDCYFTLSDADQDRPNII